jgi:Spy/CpxP family protein refolding chaperone
MRKVTRIVLLALALQITNVSHFIAAAQTQPALAGPFGLSEAALRNLNSYRKALEINPNFPNAAARDVVKKLSEELAQRNQD